MKKIFHFFWQGFLASTLVSFALFSGVLEPLEKTYFDFFASWTQDRHPSAPIRIIAVPPVVEGEEPTSRMDYALLLRVLAGHRPQVVAFEIPLPAEDAGYPSSDQQLAKAVVRLPRVLFCAPTAVPLTSVDLPANLPCLPYQGSIESLPKTSTCLWPCATFAAQAHIGPLGAQGDSDGIVRRVPLIYRFGNSIVPSWILQIFGLHQGVDWGRSTLYVDHDKYILLRDSKGGEISRIPIDGQGRFSIFYRKGVRWREQEAWDLKNIFLAEEQMEKKIAPIYHFDQLQKMAMIVAQTDSSQVMRLQTPLGEFAPVYIYQQVLENLFNHDYVRKPSVWVVVVLLFGLGVLGAWLYQASQSGFWQALRIFIPTSFALHAGVLVIYDPSPWSGLQFPAVACYLAFLLGFMFSFINTCFKPRP